MPRISKSKRAPRAAHYGGWSPLSWFRQAASPVPSPPPAPFSPAGRVGYVDPFSMRGPVAAGAAESFVRRKGARGVGADWYRMHYANLQDPVYRAEFVSQHAAKAKKSRSRSRKALPGVVDVMGILDAAAGTPSRLSALVQMFRADPGTRDQVEVWVREHRAARPKSKKSKSRSRRQ